MRVCPVDKFLDLNCDCIDADLIWIRHLIPKFGVFCLDVVSFCVVEIEPPKAVDCADGEFAELSLDGRVPWMLIAGFCAGSSELVSQLFLDGIFVLEKGRDDFVRVH